MVAYICNGKKKGTKEDQILGVERAVDKDVRFIAVD